MKVSILHNISRDASFGFNAVFRTGDQAPEGVRAIALDDGRVSWKAEAETEAERHELVWVFTYEGDSAKDDETLLAEAWHAFNVGHDPEFGPPSDLALAYRARKLRSLSMGDVVIIGHSPQEPRSPRIWSCDSDWTERQQTDLRILPASDADKAIRARMDFGPDEPLTHTVPLAD